MDIYEARAFLALCIALLLAGTAAGLWLLWRAGLRPFARWLLFLIFAVEVLLGILHQLKYTVGVNPPLVYQFYLHSEFAPTPLLSSTQLVMTALTALLLACFARPAQRAERLLWSWLGLYLMYFAIDEYFSFHERMAHWQSLYLAATLPLALPALWVWRRNWRRQWPVPALLVTGAAVMAVSALVIEKPVIHARFLIGQMRMFEELFEMVGVTLVLGGLLILAQRRLDAAAWRRLTRVVPLAGLVLVPVLAGYTWALPAVELQLTARPLHVEWRGGDLLLRGARVDGSPARAGDTVSVWLYWEARNPMWEDEDLSLHAVTWPDLAHSFASSEESKIGQYSSTGFIPGVVVRKQISLTLPAELPTPTSLALLLRLWNGSHSAGTMRGIDIHHSQQQVAGTDQVVIGRIAVPGPAPETPLANTINAQFGDRHALTGYALPASVAAGAELALSLDREALAAPEGLHTQFLHLFSLTDDRFAAGFDELPFGGRFPAPDWPVGHTLRDHWRITLPAQLAPGEYRLVYGLYDTQTQERLALQLAGRPVADGLLPLGTLKVLPGGV